MCFSAMDKTTISFPQTLKHLCVYLLQFIHMWKIFFHKLSSCFPQFLYRFPHLFRMWKTYQQVFFPQDFFHIFVFFQAVPALSAWKTMWKVWKFPHLILP